MRWFLRPLFLLLLVVGSICAPPVQVTPPPADAPAEEVALTGASVLIGTGDIGNCGNQGNLGAKATAKLMSKESA